MSKFLDKDGLSYFWDKLKAKFALKADLSSVATSGSYSDLSNKPTKLSQFTNDSKYVKNTDYATTTVAGVIKRGNWITLSDDGKLQAGELTKDQYNSAAGVTFIGKTTLENILSSVAKSGSYNDLVDAPNLSEIETKPEVHIGETEPEDDTPMWLDTDDEGALPPVSLKLYAKKAELAGYLPLTGGTITGNLVISNGRLYLGQNKYIYIE